MNKNLFKYCFVLFLTLVFNSTFAQKKQDLELLEIAGETYCKKNKLVVYADSQEQLVSAISKCASATSVHISLYSDEKYDFNFLRKYSDIKILSIEFPQLGENNDVYDGGLNSMNIIDCSFLEDLANLEFLVIDWCGAVRNIEKISTLKNLIYARLPLSAFHPNLFSDNSSIQQYEFGNNRGIILQRDQGIKKLNLPTDHYENFLSQSTLKARLFRMKAHGNNRKNKDVWPNDLMLYNIAGDTLLYMSNKQEGSVSWCFGSLDYIRSYSGTYNSEANRLENKLNHASIERDIMLEGENEYSIHLKRKQLGNVDTYMSEKQLGYKDGFKHGTFSESTNGQLDYKQNFENGRLTYTYHGVRSLPNLSIGSPLDYQIKITYAPMIEIFYEGEDTLLIRAFSGRKEALTTHKMLEVPYVNNKAEGNVIVFNQSGDTMTIAEYKEGVLDGEYYNYHITSGDTIIEKSNYKKGQLDGELIKTSNTFTHVANYSKGERVYYVMTKNDDNQKIMELIWYPDKNYSETTFWSNEGEIIRVLRNNQNGKVIYNHEYPTRMKETKVDIQP